MEKLTRGDLKALTDARTEEMQIPEWGGAVTVRALTLDERLQLGAFYVAGADEDDGGMGEAERTIEATLFAVLHGLAEPELTDEDAEWLRQRDAEVLGRIAGRVLQLSGLAPEVTEDLVGKSGAGQN